MLHYLAIWLGAWKGCSRQCRFVRGHFEPRKTHRQELTDHGYQLAGRVCYWPSCLRLETAGCTGIGTAWKHVPQIFHR